MGDPKKNRKKYSPSRHPWISKEIEEGKKLKKEYGLRRRKEILIASSFLKKYKDIAKRLTAIKNAQGEKEKVQILNKLQQLGLLPVGAELDQILGLEVKDILERRLQSLVFRNKLARTVNQARQFIIHRHIVTGNQEINVPSYLVSLEEESKLGFKEKSALSNEEHPERALPTKIPEEAGKKKKEKKEEMKKAAVNKNEKSEGTPQTPEVPAGKVIVEQEKETAKEENQE